MLGASLCLLLAQKKASEQETPSETLITTESDAN